MEKNSSAIAYYVVILSTVLHVIILFVNELDHYLIRKTQLSKHVIFTFI